MSIAFYMDEHVDGAITRALRALHVDVLTVQEDDREGGDDINVIRRATELRRVVFTYDEDFLSEAAALWKSGEPFAGVLYLPSERLSVGDVIDQLQFIGVAYDPSDFSDTVIYLPLK